MTTATLCLPRSQKAGIGWKVLCGAALLLISMLLAFYAWQVKHLTNGAYLMESYEKQVLQLVSEKKNLELNFAESSFLGEVQQKIREMGFEKVISVRYIQLPDNELAKK